MSTSTSPTGRFEITTSEWEARMSHWIESPTLSDKVTGEELLSFKDPNWSLDSAEWQSDSTVVLTLRKYPGGHQPVQVVATVDCLARTADVNGTAVASLGKVEQALDRALTWNR